MYIPYNVITTPGLGAICLPAHTVATSLTVSPVPARHPEADPLYHWELPPLPQGALLLLTQTPQERRNLDFVCRGEKGLRPAPTSRGRGEGAMTRVHQRSEEDLASPKRR